MINKKNTYPVPERYITPTKWEAYARPDRHAWFFRVKNPAALTKARRDFHLVKRKGYIMAGSNITGGMSDVYPLPVKQSDTMQTWADELIRQRDQGFIVIYGKEKTVSPDPEDYGPGGHPKEEEYEFGKGRTGKSEEEKLTENYAKGGISGVLVLVFVIIAVLWYLILGGKK